MATKTKSKPAKVEEVDEDELEELDEDVEEEVSSKSKSKTPAVEFGVADLAKHISEKIGKEYSTRDLRTLIRKMAREDNARVNREIIPGNRTRYDWAGGLKNPEVKKIIKAVMDGEVEVGKKEALDKLKERTAAKGAKSKKGKKGKGKPAPVVEDDDDDEDIEELEEDDDDE